MDLIQYKVYATRRAHIPKERTAHLTGRGPSKCVSSCPSRDTSTEPREHPLTSGRQLSLAHAEAVRLAFSKDVGPSSTHCRAQKLGLQGWVRNSPDESVEGIAVGPSAKIEQL